MILAAAVAASLLVTPTDTVTAADVRREYQRWVRIETTPVFGQPDSVPVVTLATDSVPRGSLLHDFLAAHGDVVMYLAGHTPGAFPRFVRKGDRPEAVRDSIIATLQASPPFNERLFAMLVRYWRPRGRVITGDLPPAPRIAVTTLELRQIAARFYFPDRVSAVGDTLFVHICSGANGITQLTSPVDPLVEAVVFVAVNRATFRPHSALYRDFDAAFTKAKQVSFSKDSTTRILRAQGALWAEMERSHALDEALRSAFASRRAVLPIEVAGRQ